jgi:predicted RNase H-like HicB family nuclease
MKRDRYIYPAIFDYEEDGISIEFPDLPGCLTSGNTDAEALRMAKDALALHLYGMEQDGEEIPQPTPVSQLRPKTNQAVVLVDVWMRPFRDEMEQR